MVPRIGRVTVLTKGTRLPFSKKTAVRYAEKILSMLNMGSERACILFMNDLGIKRLNKKYRKRDKSTDVLAFETGDIAISAERAAKNSKRFGSTVADELKLYMIHGILHLFGYDDGNSRDSRKMARKQNRILDKLCSCRNLSEVLMPR